jgi:hypothetical protein
MFSLTSSILLASKCTIVHEKCDNKPGLILAVHTAAATLSHQFKSYDELAPLLVDCSMLQDELLTPGFDSQLKFCPEFRK